VVTLSCAELTTREVNARLRSLPDGEQVLITEPRGRHNLAVGLTCGLDITIDGNAGYFIGGLCDGPDITVNGFVGWSCGENLMQGTIRVHGNASECTGATAHGGVIVVEGDAGESLGDSLYEAVVYVGGKVRSLGSDARVEDLTTADVARVRELVAVAGFDHVDPENVSRVASAKQLYNFDALKTHHY